MNERRCFFIRLVLPRRSGPGELTELWRIRDNGDGTCTIRRGKPGGPTWEETKSLKWWGGDVNEFIRLMLAQGGEYLGSDGDLENFDRDGHYYWEVTARGEEWKSLSTALAEIGLTLEAMGLATSDGAGYRVGTWTFPEERQRAGALCAKLGPLPLLVLLSLKKRTGMAEICDEDGVEVSTNLRAEKKALAFFNSGLEEIRPVAEALGLLAARLDEIQTDIPDMYF